MAKIHLVTEASCSRILPSPSSIVSSVSGVNSTLIACGASTCLVLCPLPWTYIIHTSISMPAFSLSYLHFQQACWHSHARGTGRRRLNINPPVKTLQAWQGHLLGQYLSPPLWPVQPYYTHLNNSSQQTYKFSAIISESSNFRLSWTPTMAKKITTAIIYYTLQTKQKAGNGLCIRDSSLQYY